MERRKQLQEELRELKKWDAAEAPKAAKFETSVVIGERLLAMTKGVRNWQERDCFKQMQKYLNSDATDRVCLVFGLRRTGKTTMLRQAVLKMSFKSARFDCGYSRRNHYSKCRTFGKYHFYTTWNALLPGTGTCALFSQRRSIIEYS